jgi:hypothetical protein
MVVFDILNAYIYIEDGFWVLDLLYTRTRPKKKEELLFVLHVTFVNY